MQLEASLVLLLACFIAAGICQSVPCPSVVGGPSCVCYHPDGNGLIDLRPIANPINDPNGPRYDPPPPPPRPPIPSFLPPPTYPSLPFPSLPRLVGGGGGGGGALQEGDARAELEPSPMYHCPTLSLIVIYTHRFTGVEDEFGYAYSYNPCYSYGEGLCGNVHVCQTSNFNDEITYSIASGGSEEMYIDADGTPYVYYTGPEGRYSSTTTSQRAFVNACYYIGPRRGYVVEM